MSTQLYTAHSWSQLKLERGKLERGAKRAERANAECMGMDCETGSLRAQCWWADGPVAAPRHAPATGHRGPGVQISKREAQGGAEGTQSSSSRVSARGKSEITNYSNITNYSENTKQR